MKLEDIQEAQTDDVTLTVYVPFQVKNGDGSYHEQRFRVDYRPLTPEILEIQGVANQLAATVKAWEAEEPPTLETLRSRSLRFLNRISEAIVSDFFPEKKP